MDRHAFAQPEYDVAVVTDSTSLSTAANTAAVVARTSDDQIVGTHQLYSSVFFYAIASPRTSRAFRSLHTHIAASNVAWDQAAFNDMFKPLGSEWGYALRAFILEDEVTSKVRIARSD